MTSYFHGDTCCCCCSTRQAQLQKLRSIVVRDIQLYTSSSRGGYKTKVQMFAQGDDPDPNYVLTMDNAKKLLAIHQRLR